METPIQTTSENNFDSNRADKFSLKRVLKITGVIVLAAAVIAGGYFFITSRLVKVAWASAVLDEHQPYSTCYELPFYEQVQSQLSKHADILDKLKQTGAEIEPEKIECSGYPGGIVFLKGDLQISYKTHQQRRQIEKIIGDNFFGIAYRGNKS